MKRNRVSRSLGYSVLLVTLLVLATAPALGEEFQCSQELLTGAWAYIYPYEDLEGDDAGAVAGHGIVVFDDEGRTTSFVHAEVNKTSVMPPTDIAPFFDIQMKVDADCTGLTVFRDRSTGDVIQETRYVFGNGQRLAWGLTLSPSDWAGIVTMRKLQPDDKQLEVKVDAIAEDLEETKDLIRTMAAALGINFGKK
jgi:hypothetical protein